MGELQRVRQGTGPSTLVNTPSSVYVCLCPAEGVLTRVGGPVGAGGGGHMEVMSPPQSAKADAANRSMCLVTGNVPTS